MESVLVRAQVPRSSLGHGEMGSVYLAHDDRLDRMVALRILHLHLMATGELRRRFEREAKLTARLDHPGIVALKPFDRGVD
ncbi:hypothetical protein ACQP1G_37300 [Nocardia sp. CA-107356]|uniref:hypothetical protein n=1 Tax=Nocardia sp. CA-107356 TaxID=3239972 RepID=UPI003D8F66BB